MANKMKQDTLHRNIVVNQIRELFEFAKLAVDDVSLHSLFKIRVQFLEDNYSSFKDLHLSVVASLPDDKNKDDKLKQEDALRKEIDACYFGILDIKSHLLPEVKVVEPKTEQSTSSSLKYKARLPELSLPTFTGDVKYYENYIDIYNSLIHENSELNDIAKFQYLVMSLSGEPLNLIKTIPLTASNYELAYKTLTDRYSNKRLLASVHLNAIKMYPPLRSDNPAELRKLVDCFVENVAILNKIGLPVVHWDFILLELMLEKLDNNTRKRFELHSSSTAIPKFSELKEFLLKQCVALESITVNKESQKQTPNKFMLNSNKSNTKTTLVSNESNNNNCILCRKPHFVFKCPTFLSKTPLERYDIAKQNSLCIGCLRPNHTVRNCKSLSSCRSCHSKTHNSLLHRGSSQSAGNSSSDTSVQNTSQASSENVGEDSQNLLSANCSSQNKPNVLLGTIILELRDSNGNYRSVRVLLDNASQCSFISQHCLRRFGLKQTRLSTPIQGIGQSSSQSCGSTKVTIRPKGESSLTFDLDVVVLQPICANMPNFSIESSENWHHLKNLKLADPQFMKAREIDLLIGAELYPYILREGIIKSPDPRLPVAINTVFGYVVCGNVSKSKSSNLHAFCCTLDTSVRQFWEVEKIPEKKFLAPDDEKCEEIFSSEVARTDEGRFVVPLPLKNSEPFGDSYPTAHRRLLSLEHRLEQNPHMKQSYLDFMKDYLDQGHMELIPPSQPEPELVYYIPHQYVAKEGSKFRVVFDASSRTDQGISLNDKQFVGPKLQSDISEILLRFRQHLVVFSADIKQMFRNILLHGKYQDLQRILFRFTVNEPISKYQLKTVTYGLASSPYLAIRTLHQLAKDEKDRYPTAASVLLRDTFVDDILSGASSLKQALSLQKDLIELLKAGGFVLRKWVSNRSELLAHIPSEDQAISFDTSEPSFLKILGLCYSPSDDCFFYKINSTEITCSKRQILSDIARIFDPLGFLSPITLQAKRLIQSLWINGVGWDDPPPSDVVDIWHRFKSELTNLSNLRIERYIPLDTRGKDVSIQLHGFSDASSHGLSAVVYFRITLNESPQTYLVCGKTKVAPLKQVSIPRLELMAAHMLAILIDFVVETYKQICKINSIYCWSDSTVALSWIKSSPHKWKPFVANRVSAIQELISPSFWHYISSSENPADAPSRGQFPMEFLENSLWFEGPSWLKYEESDWPLGDSHINLNDSALEAESKKSALSLLTSCKQDNPILGLLDRFSSLKKIIRIVSYVKRFIGRLRKSSHESISGPILARELHDSLMTVVRVVQRIVFEQEVHNLENSKPCSKPFRKLNAFICPAGIFRVGGRLTHSDLDFNEKHPAILPKSHRLTELIIEDTHNKYLHPGFNTLKFLIQQNFWILSPKKAISKCLSRCIRCFRSKPKFIEPFMGNLPSFRVNKQLKPFMSVGIDYGGPFTIKCAKHRSKVHLKAYLCLFVCTTTKAVHLELVSELTAESFLAALRRFIARRGTCIEIISDNGTNFVAANKVLNEYCKQAAESQSISWRFNPPSTPHMGGLFESGIKSVKTHLRRVIGNQILTFEELYTIITQVEAILNSRPIGPISSDPNDLLPLTPGHFLTLQPLTAPPEFDTTNLELNRLSRWQLVQRIVQDTWKRFRHEYLHTLQQRTKWHNKSAISISPGMLVLIKDDSLPPLKWSLGRVKEVHAGPDGIVRVVTLRTSTGTCKRPVVKICPFPSD